MISEGEKQLRAAVEVGDPLNRPWSCLNALLAAFHSRGSGLKWYISPEMATCIMETYGVGPNPPVFFTFQEQMVELDKNSSGDHYLVCKGKV